jgi:predicted CXXCH cytochrome family protein
MMNVRKILNGKWLKFALPLFLLALSGFFLSLGAEEQAAKPSTELSNSDCIKCHANVQATVDSKGAKHKTAVTCMGCHQGHPPMVSKEKIIPLCSSCHAGKPHYEIGGCNTCHSDPHAPLEMQLAANLTTPCLSCHPQQGKETQDHPSLHSKLFCTTCHKTHKEIPECLKCHQPHSTDMVNKDCTMCHPAHMPLVITYTAEMPNKNCAACHKTISDMLAGSATKHSALTCVFCHKEKHKYIPACESCHGSPHPAGMIKQFPKCEMCHMNAHSLGKEVKK